MGTKDQSTLSKNNTPKHKYSRATPRIFSARKDVDSKSKEEYLASQKEVKGTPLNQFLQPDKLPSTDWCFDLFKQVCDAVQVFHQQGIFHWQLETKKIHLVEVPKTTEIIGLKPDKKDDKKDKNKEETPPPKKIECSEYTAPEVKLGALPNERSEVYAVATIFYELLTSELPSEESVDYTEQEKRFKDYIWNALHEVIEKARNPDPLERYETVKEFLEAIEDSKKDPTLPESSAMDSFREKIQNEMGKHVKKFITKESTKMIRKWMGPSLGGGGGGGGDGSLGDEFTSLLIKESFGILLASSSSTVKGAIERKIASAQSTNQTWRTRLFAIAKMSIFWVGMLIGVASAGGLKVKSLFSKKPTVHKQTKKKKVKKDKSKLRRLWRWTKQKTKKKTKQTKTLKKPNKGISTKQQK